MSRKTDCENKATDLASHPGLPVFCKLMNMAEFCDSTILKEIDFNIDQLRRFAATEHGKGQLAAWEQVRSFFK